MKSKYTPIKTHDCDFSNPALLKKYGTWFQVQVAFYDFLFTSSMKMCAHHCNKTIQEGFAEGSNSYETAKRSVELTYPTMKKAWLAFCKESL